MRRRMAVFYVNLGASARGPDVAVNVVVDDSASMAGEPIGQVRAAVEAFLAAAPERTRVGLVGFGDRVHVYAAPTEHRDFLLCQTARLEARGTATRLFDAVGEACDGFDEDGRERHVLVLTDGNDNASERFALQAGKGREAVGAHALERHTRITVVGFGSVDHATVEALAAETGGLCVFAPDPADLVRCLADVLGWIEGERRQVRVRREFERLLESSQVDADWLFQMSIEESTPGAVSWDGETLRFGPPGTERTSTAYRAHFQQAIAVHLRRAMKEMVETRARRGIPVEADFDVFVLGHLSDPAFRAFGPEVVGVTRALARDVTAFRDTHYAVFVPLVRGLGEEPPEVRTDCYAWLTAALNAGSRSPNALLSLGDSNWHRARNRSGFLAADAAAMASQAALVLWGLALDHARVGTMTAHAAAGWPVWSAGAVTVNVGPGPLLDRDTLAALSEAVRGLRERQPRAGVPAGGAASLLANERATVEALKEDLLAPIEGQSPEGTLAAIHLSPVAFWPPPAGVQEEGYLPTLSTWIEQRGSEYLSFKIAALRRALSQRAARSLERLEAATVAEVDRTLFGCDDASLPQARALLAELSASAEAEKLRLGGDASGPLLQSLFPEVGAGGVHDSGAVGRAKDVLEQRIANRPRAEALALRHGFLAVAAGILVARVAGLVPHVLIDLGPLQFPPLAGLIVAACVAGAGALRWRVARARLASAVRDYVAAQVAAARARALSETLEALRAFYDRLRAWLGEVDSPPPWAAPAVRTEQDLTQRELLAELDAHLERSLSELRRWLDSATAVANPFVWASEDPIPCHPEIRVPRPAIGRVDLAWSALAPLAETGAWREIARRRVCQDLEEHLAFHRERLAFSARLWEGARKRVLEHARSRGSVGQALSEDPPSSADLDVILRCMQSRSFPPIGGLEAGEPEVTWIGQDKEIKRLRTRSSGVDTRSRGLLGRESVDLGDPWTLTMFQVVSTGLLDAPEWARCREDWRRLSPEDRAALLAAWGDAAAWLDPADGTPALPRQPPATASDEEGL